LEWFPFVSLKPFEFREPLSSLVWCIDLLVWKSWTSLGCYNHLFNISLYNDYYLILQSKLIVKVLLCKYVIKQEALKRRLNARIQYAKFLQDTVKEMAKEIKSTRTGAIQRTAEDLDEFMNKVSVWLIFL
jgi:hypothetical protein